MTLSKQPLPSAKSAQKRQTILLSVAGHLVSQGFSNSGIRALAKSAGISDRMLLYYFETKEALLHEALSLLFNDFSSHLDTILPQARASSTEIVAALVASSTTDASRPMLALWFEIVGLAMRGDEPFKTTAAQFLGEWERWIANKLAPAQRHRAGELLAQVEGSVMVTLLR